MKTQVMYLDSQDDVISIRDKMQWTKASRLLLVFPSEARFSARTLDLLLLQRHAKTLGTQLGLVTTSRDVCRAASLLGIPTFLTIDDAQDVKWKLAVTYHVQRPHKGRSALRELGSEVKTSEASWQSSSKVRLSFFISAVICIIAILFTLLPSAKVTLTARREVQSSTVSFLSSHEIRHISQLGEVPASSIIWPVDESRTIAITSKGSVPMQPAEGIVVFSNLGLDVVGIPAGTIVRNQAVPPIRFATLVDGILPGEVGSTLEIQVRAVEAGLAGNLPADSISIIEGNLGARLVVKNPNPMVGGTEAMRSAPSKDDRERLYEILVNNLREVVIDEVGSSLGPGTLVIPDSVQPSPDLAGVYSPVPGQPGMELTLNLSGEFRLEYVSGADILEVGKLILDASMPDGYVALPDTLLVSIEKEPVTAEDGVTRWTARFDRDVHPVLEQNSIAWLVRGRTPAEASRILTDTFFLDATPKFEITPSFWPWLPVTTLRIGVQQE